MKKRTNYSDLIQESKRETQKKEERINRCDFNNRRSALEKIREAKEKIKSQNELERNKQLMEERGPITSVYDTRLLPIELQVAANRRQWLQQNIHRMSSDELIRYVAMGDPSINDVESILQHQKELREWTEGLDLEVNEE